jgi:hypothetical protein
VVTAGVTTLLPVKATLPTPWSIVTDVAPVTVQVSWVVSPGEIDDGLASKLFIAGISAAHPGAAPSVRYTHPVASIRKIMIGINSFFIHAPPYLHSNSLNFQRPHYKPATTNPGTVMNITSTKHYTTTCSRIMKDFHSISSSDIFIVDYAR